MTRSGPNRQQSPCPAFGGGTPITLPGYPIHMVHAEKIVTAIQRGIANTRWRDFGDIWSLSRRHRISGEALRQAITEVASYRGTTVRPLIEVLDGFAFMAQAQWSQWRRRSNIDGVPEQFEPVLHAVTAFADPVLTDAADGLTWDPEASAWT